MHKLDFTSGNLDADLSMDEKTPACTLKNFLAFEELCLNPTLTFLCLILKKSNKCYKIFYMRVFVFSTYYGKSLGRNGNESNGRVKQQYLYADDMIIPDNESIFST